MNRILCVVGPTASGKTALAVALARALNGEVVSADSMQIYRGLDIGTAKPTADEMAGVAHHMLSIAEPTEVYSVARYVESATAIVQNIQDRGKIVIVAGGTGLYVDSFVKGLDFSTVPEGGTIRERLSAMYDRFGGARLHRLLMSRNPSAAARIHCNDKKRLVRGLELSFAAAGGDDGTAAVAPQFDALYIGLGFSDREKLYRRCDARVDAMMEAGLLEEARKVHANADTWKTATQAIGYKELFCALDNPDLLPLAVENLKRSTRRYAKRQLTWFRKNTEIRWIYHDLTDDAVSVSTEIAKDFLYNAQ